MARSERWADDPVGAGVGLPAHTWRQGKGHGVDRMLRRGSDAAETPHRARVALGAGGNIAANPPVLARSSSGRRCSLAAALIRTDGGSHTRSPSPCPSSTRHQAELEVKAGTECSPPLLACDGTTSQPCLASGGSVHVATQRACRPVAGT